MNLCLIGHLDRIACVMGVMSHDFALGSVRNLSPIFKKILTISSVSTSTTVMSKIC